MAQEQPSASTDPVPEPLRPGDQVDGLYACTRKDRQVGRTGSAYLSVELRDRTGTLSARIFRDPDVASGRFDRGDIVRVRGRVERYRDQLTVDVETIERAPDADPAAFLPTAYRDIEELDGFLEHLAGEVHHAEFAGLLGRMLGDGTLRAAWRRAPCSRAGHHAYLGGLLEHTVAVGTLVSEVCILHRKLNPDLLMTAALVHDIGRTQEFTYGAEFGLTTHGRLLGHVELGLRLIERYSDGMGAERRAELAHCVLGHHGADALPGRRFALPEAVALNRINALDAGVKAAFEQGLGA